MRKRTPGMYAYYKNEVTKALAEDYDERVCYLMRDMPYEILVELRKESVLPPRADSRKRSYKSYEEWTVTYTRVNTYTIDTEGDSGIDKRVIQKDIVDHSFPTSFENGIMLDDVVYKIDVRTRELEGDRDA
jgi:hypothetical protein